MDVQVLLADRPCRLEWAVTSIALRRGRGDAVLQSRSLGSCPRVAASWRYRPGPRASVLAALARRETHTDKPLIVGDLLLFEVDGQLVTRACWPPA